MPPLGGGFVPTTDRVMLYCSCGSGQYTQWENMTDDVKPPSARWVGGNNGDRISRRDVKHPSREVGAGTREYGVRV